jgi:hypothetical protein
LRLDECAHEPPQAGTARPGTIPPPPALVFP